MRNYAVYVTPAAWDEIRALPGNMRQRVRRAIADLANDPRPAASKQLKALEFPNELRRLRLDRWRIVYAITEIEHVVDVLGVRKRPPYDYGDLNALLEEIDLP
jgi:mRNA interferase RelE/StbE